MSEIEINKVLTQMRTLATSLQPADGAMQPGGVNFGQVLQQTISQVSNQQQAAQTMIKDFQTGTGNASVAEVMISMQKASLSFEAMTQVRNRLVEAYQQIMNMPI